MFRYSVVFMLALLPMAYNQVWMKEIFFLFLFIYVWLNHDEFGVVMHNVTERRRNWVNERKKSFSILRFYSHYAIIGLVDFSTLFL